MMPSMEGRPSSRFDGVHPSGSRLASIVAGHGDRGISPNPIGRALALAEHIRGSSSDGPCPNA